MNTLLKSNETYKHLFLHSYLTSDNIRLKQLYYHAIKENLISGYKCTLNLKNNNYELRQILNNKTDWTTKPLMPTTEQLSHWSISYQNYSKKKQQESLSKNQ